MGLLRGHLLVVAAAACFFALAEPTAAQNPIEGENARPGDFAWTVTTAPEGAIEGYSSQASAFPGSAVDLHVNVPSGDRYRIEVHRLGWYAGRGGRRILCVPSCTGDEPGAAQPAAPPPDPVTGEVEADWPVTDSFVVGSDWVSGYYVAELQLTTGASAGMSRRVPFIVREGQGVGVSEGRRSAIVVQVPVNTWQAYNSWGGKSLYAYNSSDGVAAVRVSFNRPYNLFAQSLFTWEYQLVRFLERERFDVSYVTDVDVHQDVGLLLDHRAVVVAGHDEYWTGEMRDAFEFARDHGTNLAFLGANTAFWQMRYANGGRTIEEYRTAAADPEPDPNLKTVRFRELGRPECTLLGVEYRGGQRAVDDPPRAYVLDDASLAHPWMNGTGFQAGAVLPDLVGYEWDAVVPGCTQAPLTRLFHYEGLPSNADAVAFTAPSGARVFASGSVQLSWALDDYQGHAEPADPRVQQFMRNVLADMVHPAPAKAVTAEATGNTVQLTFDLPNDPRVEGYVYREVGEALDDAMPVCVTTGEPCTDAPPSGTYRYVVQTTDRWNVAAPVTSAPVEVINVLPTPAIDASSESPLTRELVTLSGAESVDEDGEIVSHAWDLDGDGEFDDAWGREAAVTFSEPGTHVISLRVTDTNGESGTTEFVLTARPNVRVEGSTLVYEAAPEEANSISIDQGKDGFSVADDVGSIGSGDGCVASDGHALCNGEISHVRVEAGGGADRVVVDVAVPTEITGGAGDDELMGGPAADILIGGEGDDVLTGQDDDDLLRGGDGRDHESGGRGDDMLFEAAAANGADLLDGGPGQDTVSYSERIAPLVVTLGGRANDGEAGELDDVTAVERVLGGSGDDLVLGTVNREVLSGRSGSDELLGRSGRDTLSGGSGGDVLKPGIDGHRDLVRGGDGIDWARVERLDRAFSIERLHLVG